MKNEENSFYPTGTTIVVPEEWMKEFLKENEQESMIDSVIEAKQMLMADHLVQQLIEDIKKAEEDPQEESTDENN